MMVSTTSNKSSTKIEKAKAAKFAAPVMSDLYGQTLLSLRTLSE